MMETMNALEEEEEEKMTLTKTPPVLKHVPGAVHGRVSDRITEFRNKAEALSKPTPEWTIIPEDPL